MYHFIIKLSNILNELKDTTAGHGSRSDAFYVRHKNKHWYFVVVNWLSLIIQIALGFFILKYL